MAAQRTRVAGQFESITVYQRGWRLGGKGASSRGENGRIEEHGLHVWLGSYENAFALLRECYAELDRATTDPAAPIHDWSQALIPADNLGLADRWGSEWLVWPGRFPRNEGVPGEPDATGREMTVLDFLRRALQLVLDFSESVSLRPHSDSSCQRPPMPPPTPWMQRCSRSTRGGVALAGQLAGDDAVAVVDRVLDAIRDTLDTSTLPNHRRSWLLLSLVTATARGLISDGLLTDPRGFRAINGEDFGDWVLRHRAHPDVVEFPLVRALYDMVFGY